MENYNSFQSIIDAFKAEYVNARNLKKSATAKKRTARNAASFNTRKDNESTIIETRLTSIESSLDSTLSTAIDTLDSVRFSDLNKKLADLKGKLSLFDAETDRLTALVNIDSEKYDPWTSREQQAHQVVRNVLVNAISEAETAITDIYTGVDYSAVKAATTPSALTHSADEVVTYFASLKSNFDTVKEDLKTAVDEYTQDIFKVSDDINEKSQECIQGSKILLDLKSQLADLLDNEGSESDINNKESQIDSHKENLLDTANTLKEHWAKFDSFISSGNVNRFTKIIELSHSLEDIYNEVIDYRDDNLNFLSTNQNFSFDHYSGYEILGVFSELFEKIMDNAGNLLNIQDFNPGDPSRRQQIMVERIAMSKSEAEMNAIRANDIFTVNPSTGHYELKKDINPDLVSNYVTYQQRTGYITDLTTKHADRKSTLERFDFYLDRFNGEGMDKINQITNRYERSRRHWKDFSNQYDKLDKGYWTGTEEQNNQWNYLYSSINSNGGLWETKILIGGEKKKAEKRYSLHMQLFPDFYPTFETLNTTKENAIAAKQALLPEYDSLHAAIDSTYNFLNTLTEVDEEYQAAFTAWNDATSALQSYTDAYNALTPQYNSLVSNLAEVSALYGGGINFGSGFDGVIFSTAIQSDGKILVGGDFSSYNGTGASKIIRLNTDGSRDTSFVIGTGFSGLYPWVRSIAIQSDGKIVVVGNFANYKGTSASKIIRLNSDGSRDTSFVIGTGFDSLGYSIAIQSDGKIVVGGWFSSYNGSSANKIIRLNTDGSRDTSFVTGTGIDGLIKLITIQSDGKIVVGGNFSEYNGTNANKIIRLNSDGSRDTSFVIGTGFDSDVNSIAIQSDGKIVVGGEFYWYNGTFVKRIIRLNTDGSVDTSFVYGDGFNGYANSVAIQSDGKIVVGGQFQIYNGTNANYIIRLNSNGSIDTSSVYGTGFDGNVESITIQSNGKILVGGYFTSYQGTGANGIIQLSDSFNAEFEDEFNAATDALNTFETDVRQPAIAAMANAEVAVVEPYNFLQTLTETDEEYVAALAAYVAAPIALQSFVDNTLNPAEVAKEAAEAAFESHIQGTHEVIGLPVGTYTCPGTNLVSYFNEYQDQSQNYSTAVAAVQNAESELQTLEGQMTRSTPTENDKRDKVKMDYKLQQAYLLNMKFEEDYFAGIDTLMYIINQKITQAKDHIIEIDNDLPALTAEAMAFITGTAGPAVNPLFDSVKKHGFSYELKKYHSNMASMENTGLANIMNSLGIICNTDETSLIDASVFNNFVLDLRGYATEKYIQFGRNISTLVINEIENGGSSF